MVKQQLPLTNISHLIPQKVPFVMVDSLLEFTQEKVVSAFKILDTNLFLEDGKLNEPGIVENMAQSVALHTGYDYFLKGEKAPTGYIGSIKKVEVFKRPELNETILSCISSKPISKSRFVKDEVVVSCNVTYCKISAKSIIPVSPMLTTETSVSSTTLSTDTFCFLAKTVVCRMLLLVGSCSLGAALVSNSKK